MSRKFEIDRGVAQGCPLSPTLFGCYINSLINKIDELRNGVDLHDGKNPIGILAYADDIVMMANSNEKLQQSINVAYKWCKEWGMKANVTKCGVQSFGLNKNDPTPIIRWGSAFFPYSKKYKYLGLNFEPDMKWATHIKKIHDAAVGKHSISNSKSTYT